MKYGAVTLIELLFVPIVQASCLVGLRDIREARPCVMREVQVVAYLNVSKHGAWLSDSAGALKNAVELQIEEASSDPSIKALKRYLYRPQDYLHKTFRARFSGMTQCIAGNKGSRVIVINRVSSIEISPIK